MPVNTLTKEAVRLELADTLNTYEMACAELEAAADTLQNATTEQQSARTLEKEGEALIIQQNPGGLFTPRKSSPEEKEAYLRSTIPQVYKNRATAEDALRKATHTHAMAVIHHDRLKTRTQSLRAILESFNG